MIPHIHLNLPTVFISNAYRMKTHDIKSDIGHLLLEQQ